MSRNWTEVFGENNSYFGPEVAGIPRSTKIWEFAPPAYNMVPDSPVIFEDMLYFTGSVGYTAALDTRTGKLVWEVTHPVKNYLRTTVNANFLVIEPCVMDRKTGALLYNYSDVDAVSENIEECELLLGNDYLIKVWNEEESPGLLFHLSFISGEHKFVQTDLRCPFKSSLDNEIFGWQEKELVRVSVPEFDEMWSKSILIEPGINVLSTVLNNTIYCYLGDDKQSVIVLDEITGNELWHTDCEELGLEVEYPVDFAVDGRVLVAKGATEVLLIELEKYQTLWKKENLSIQELCIAGDLIFVCHENGDLAAWDKYTGEQVWQADEPLPFVKEVRACGDKVMFNSVKGVLQCYQWEDIYHSPHKPT